MVKKTDWLPEPDLSYVSCPQCNEPIGDWPFVIYAQRATVPTFWHPVCFGEWVAAGNLSDMVIESWGTGK